MSFKARRESPTKVIAEQRLYLNAARTEVVGEGDPAAAFLLAAVGQPVPAQWVGKLGLDESAPVVGTDPVERSTRPARVTRTR